MAYEEIKSHGITEDTPKNILFGAGTIHKGLKYDNSKKKWNFAESLIGSTSGGSKLTITPEVKDIELDGALVKVKGLTQKTGESVKLETNFAELTPETIKSTTLGKIAESDIEGYDLIESKATIEDGDYYENIAFVGTKTDGTPIIAILDNALCTTGFESESKNKENAVIKATFECYQSIDGDLNIAPYHIYYPSKANPLTSSVEQGE